MYANVAINGSDMTSGLSRSDKSRSTESPASSWTKADLFLLYFKERIGGLVSGSNDKQLAYLDAVKDARSRTLFIADLNCMKMISKLIN